MRCAGKKTLGGDLFRALARKSEVEESLSTGKISLSTLSSVQYFLKREKTEGRASYSQEEKLELIQSLEGKSKREVERKLAELSPGNAFPKDRERALNHEQTEIRFVAGRELFEKLERIKALIAHQNSDPAYAELFEILSDITLKKLDPGLQKSQKSTKAVAELQPIEFAATPPAAEPEERIEAPSSYSDPGSRPDSVTPKLRVYRRPAIPAATKRAVWKRDHGKSTRRADLLREEASSLYPFQLERSRFN